MMIAYVSSNSWEKKAVVTNQVMNSLNSLANHCDVVFYSPWISKKSFNKCLNFFLIDKINFVHKKLPVIVCTKNFLIEKITRLIFNIIYFIFFDKKANYLYTRDFSIIYFLSLLPKFLRPKKKIIFEAHKIYNKTSKKVNYSQEKKALSIVDLYVANSIGTKEGLINNFGIVEKKILVLSNGVNLKSFQRKRVDNNYYNKYQIKKDDKIIVYTGSFQNWKGVDVLINAVNYLDIENYKILLIGGYGKNKNRIENIVRNSKCSERIYVDGYLPQEELIKILSMSYIAVIPNKFTEEGENYTSPVKIFEYLALGLPIIASKLPAIQNILKEDENCIFFQPEDPEHLAKKITFLLNNEDLRLNMSKNNLNKSKDYSWEKRAINLIKFLKNKM